MIIVSRDKREIINFDNLVSVYVIESYEAKEKGLEKYNIDFATTDEINFVIGTYDTEERAKEVLQAIAGMYQTEKMFTCTDSEVQEIIADKYKEKGIEPFKFEMPEE